MPEKTKKLNVGLLGGGSWGTTVASLVAKNNHATLWARDPATVEEINTCHSNEKYLKGARLTPSLKASVELQDVVKPVDVLVVGVPSQGFRQVIEQVRPHIRPWVPVVSLSKGLEPDTRMRMTQIIEELLPGHPVGVLTGPNLAGEIIAGQAAAAVVAMEDPNVVVRLQQLFQSGLFRVYTNADVVGCELGGVLKNIIAIAVGIADGLEAGDNTRAAIITRGLAEITRLGVAMGGKPETFAGLTGMGDMIATCTSDRSRNHHVGFQLGKGQPLEDIVSEMVMVAEGVKTAPTVVKLAEEFAVDMPMAKDVYRILQGKINVDTLYKRLIREKPGAESEPG